MSSRMRWCLGTVLVCWLLPRLAWADVFPKSTGGLISLGLILVIVIVVPAVLSIVLLIRLIAWIRQQRRRARFADRDEP